MARVDASRRGDVVGIPNPLDRVSETFNIMQGRYTLITGGTGSGKTALTDFLFVLQPMKFLAIKSDVHYEVLYFSLERSQVFKHARWTSWLIYRDYGHILSSSRILGEGNGDDNKPLNDDEYEVLRSYDDTMEDLLEKVHIYDGKMEVEKIKTIIQRKADELGTLYFSDDIGVYRDDNPIYIEKFSDKNLIQDTKTGLVAYIELEHNGVKFAIEKDSHEYFLHNPKTFLFIVVDGIGLLGSSDFSGKKSVLDDMSITLANARDVFGFSPVVVAQNNRAISDTQRAKMHGSALGPRIEDVQGSSQMGHDADLVLGLFDPYVYKAYDEDDMYGGYNILEGMMHPSGYSRFRSLSILKNTFGFSNVSYGLGFVGESNHFQTLPYPDDEEKIQELYANIAKGKI